MSGLSGADSTHEQLEITALVENDADVLRSLLVPLGQPESGGVLLAIVDADGTAVHATVGEDSRGDALSLADSFRIGSVTKMFTAALVMTLVDRGLIALDDSVSDHLISLPVAMNVSIRDLLSHRSGIADFTDHALLGDEGEGLGKAWTPEELYEIVSGLPPRFQPGEQFAYSNTNFLLLGLLIEDVTGATYNEALRQDILTPLGMSDTYQAFHEQGDPPREAFSFLNQAPGRVAPVDFDYTSIETAAWASGDLVSTVSDLDTFLRALVSGELISSHLVEEMKARDEYGLGIEKIADTGNVIGHSGGIPGYNTRVMHDITTSRTAVMFSTNDTIGFNAVIKPMLERLALDAP